MKTLWKISTFTLLLLTLSACMPDSLTKFKEEPIKKGPDTSSGGMASDNFRYKLQDEDRIVVNVDKTTGFYVGDTIYSCSSLNFSSCSTSSQYTGIGAVYHINEDEKLLYITVQDVMGTIDPSEFFNGNYLHKSNGSLYTIQTNEPVRLYNSSSTGISLAPSWETHPAADGVSILYSINSQTPSVSIDAITGTVSLTSPMQLSDEKGYQIRAVNSENGETVATYTLNLAVFDPPGGIAYSSSTFNLGIGRDAINEAPTVTPNEFPDIDNVYYRVSGTVVAGISFDQLTGTFSGVPSAFSAGTPLTVEAYHPNSGSTAFATTSVTIKSGTPIDDLYYPQNIGEYLQLTVSDTSVFSVGQSISTPLGGQANVIDTNSGSSQIIVQTTAGLSGRQVFKKDDPLDNASTYAFQKALVSDVVHIFDSTTGFSARTPVLYNANTLVTPALGEVITYNISPSLPTDFTSFNTTTAEISATAIPLALTSAKAFTIIFANAIGDVAQKDYKFLIKSPPSEATIGRYQFIRLNQNHDQFYIGTRFQTLAGVKGKVVHKIGTATGNPLTDTSGLLVEAQGTIEAGDQIDNTNPYYATEGRVEKYIILTLKDVSGFSASEVFNTSDGDSATIINTIPAENKLYALVTTGEFEAGDSISTAALDTSIIMDVIDKHYVSHILKLGDASSFSIGGYISSDDQLGNADIVFKEDVGDYAYIQILEGAFSQTDDINSGSGTISQIVGPIIKVASSGNASGNDITSSTKSFKEGSTITSNGVERSTGIVLDVSASDFTIDVKDMLNQNSFVEGAEIDDATPFNTTLATPNTITTVSTSNIIPIYVGEEVYLEGKVKGIFSDVKLTPDTLPAGLNFDSTTGVISGIAMEPQQKTAYTISYSSPGDTAATFTFELITYNQFELIQETSLASSYILHKEGQGFGTTSCKVLSSQVSSSNTKEYQMNDIICRLEAGELDLYNRGAELKVKSGAGMCEYVRYVPEAHKSYPAGRTESYYVQYSEFPNSCAGGMAQLTTVNPITGTPGVVLVEAQAGGSYQLNTPVPTLNANATFDRKLCLAGDCLEEYSIATSDEPVCQFNHSSTQTGLNCDEGSNWTATVSCEQDDLDQCACTMSPFTETKCGGDRYSCMSGGIRSTGLDVENESSLIINSFEGVTTPFTIQSPQSQGQVRNTIVANASRPPLSKSASQNYAFDNYDNSGNLSSDLSDFISYNKLDDTARGLWADINPRGSSAMNSQKFYEYHCLDASYNLKARIRLQIREWNERFTPEHTSLELFDGPGAITTIDSSGPNCFGEECDSRWDWDSLIDNIFAGSQPTYTANHTRAANALQASTITVIAGSNVFTANAPINSAITVGSVVKVGNNLATEFRYYTVISVGSNIFLTSAPADVSATGLQWEVIRDYPFPLDHIGD